ncbi:MAG: hypothetical protein M3440_10085, partial [Chloroflexota bacterium]|nr:hypothetical protein [Chloroflexota bacterium]
AGGSAPQPYRQVGNPDTATQRDVYQLLRSLYYGNSAYADLARQRYDDGESWASIKELRMLANAVSEAYVALTMPGGLPDALPLEFAADNAHAENVRDRIHDVWTWSNWAQRKQLFIRYQAMLGNAYLYVASRADLDGKADRVYFHLPEPEHITDLDTDERGYLTYIRTDVPVSDREDPENPYVETAEWWKAHDSYRMWRTLIPQYGDGKRLGAPEKDDSMRQDYGIDFVPFVHAKHRDTGDVYGLAPIMTAIEKQHELNRKATAFSQQLYRHGKPDMLLQATGGQTNGVYAPPPPITTNSASGSVEVAGEKMWTAPPGWTIGHMIANVNYTAHMAGIDQDIAHLATTDLPELNWYRLSQSGGDASGRALQTLLKPAIAKIEEARGNAETALARADMMALTIGQFAELKDFDAASIGTYEDGSYDHQFTARSVVPAGDEEQGAVDLARVQRVKAWTDAGLGIDAAMRLESFSGEQIKTATAIVSGVER